MGCGSGRDSLTFYDLGYDVTPLDGSEEMCRLAEVHTGLDVLQMTYEEMAFDGAFDGVWACGAFVHIPKEEMPDISGKGSQSTDGGRDVLSFHAAGGF